MKRVQLEGTRDGTCRPVPAESTTERRAATLIPSPHHHRSRAARWLFERQLDTVPQTAQEAVALFTSRAIVRGTYDPEWLDLVQDADAPGCWCKLCTEHQDGKPAGNLCTSRARGHGDVITELLACRETVVAFVELGQSQ